MNKKEKKIAALYNRGITDPRTIAYKLGYKGASLTPAISYVKDVLEMVK